MTTWSRRGISPPPSPSPPRPPHPSSRLHQWSRSLQRSYVTRLSAIAMAGGTGNSDAQALAAGELRKLVAGIDALLSKEDVKLEQMSRAHLVELRARIMKVLDAGIDLPRP